MAVHGAADRQVVVVGGGDQTDRLVGLARREHWLLRRLDDGLRGAPPGWDRFYVIEAPPLSAWADSLPVRGDDVEEDAWFRPLVWGSFAPATSARAARASAMPDDPALVSGMQWGLWSGSLDSSVARGLDVRALEAWEIMERETGVARAPLAALDTGVDPQHADLQEPGAERLLAQSALAGHESDVADSLGHGTMVCGVMAALTNNHLGIAGMAGGNGFSEGGVPRVFSIKVTAGSGQAARGTDLARGIVMAVEQGARAVNISFAGTGTSDALRSALAWAVTHGCAVICGAGNSADDRPQYPAAYSDLGLCVAISAADRDGSQPPFVTRGDWIDGAAPGVDILSTWPGYPNAYGSDLRDYATSSGTSFAAPFVAGMAGLAYSVDSTLAGGDFRELFRRTARDVGVAGAMPFADASALVGALAPPYQLEHGEQPAERWWYAGEETLHVRRSAFWRSGRAIDGDYVARRFEVLATCHPTQNLGAAQTWVRPTGPGGWRLGRVHDGEESWGDVLMGPGAATVLRTYVYYISSPPVGCDTCGPVGWLPRPPWEVVLPWTRWGAEPVSARTAPAAGPRLELIGAAPARGDVRLHLSGIERGAAASSPILIFDVRGKLVRRVSVSPGRAGEAIAEWHGNDEAGRIAPAGLYFARWLGSSQAVLRFVRL